MIIHLFIILKSVSFNKEISKVQIDQISLIVGKNYLISIQETATDHFSDVAQRLYAGQGKYVLIHPITSVMHS